MVDRSHQKDLLGEYIRSIKLWRAVIAQAVRDIVWNPTKEARNRCIYRTRHNAKKTAIWWLGTDDFYYVCKLADLKANQVLKMFYKLLGRESDVAEKE